MITKHKLYNGEIELSFDDEKHLYTVGNVKVDGTTGVLSVIAKPALMFWAVNQAINHLSNCLKAGTSYDEIQIKTFLEDAKKAHRLRKEEAGDIGHLVHKWIEDYIAWKLHGKTKPTDLVHEKAKKAIEKFLEWEKDFNIEFIESERIVYSEEYNYAGTLDFVAISDDLEHKYRMKVLGDFKTSSGIWDEYWFQVAGYQQAYEEETKPRVGEAIEGRVIVRIGKDGTLEVQEKVTDYEKDREAFVSALTLHRRLTELKDEAWRKKNDTI